MKNLLKSNAVLNSLIFLIGAVVAFGIGETILRYRNPKYLQLKRGRKPPPYRRSHPIYGHGLRPGTSGYSISKGEFRVAYQINSLGMRDREYAPQKPPGTFRLLILGDSMTEGFSVELRDTFVKRLERRLNASPPQANLKYEVANLGVASFSPLLQYLFLKETLPRLEGDFLVLNLDPSDFGNDYFYQKGATWGPNGEPQQVNHSGLLPNYLSYGRHFLETLPQGPLRDSYVVRFFVWHFIRRTHQGWIQERLGNIDYDYFGWTRSNRKAGDAWDRQFKRSFSYIKKIHEAAKKVGMGFALAAYPHGFMVHPQAWCPGREKSFLICGKVYGSSLFKSLMENCQKEGLTCWDFTPIFKRSDAPKLFFNLDIHMTKAGNTLMAEELEKRLRPILEAR